MICCLQSINYAELRSSTGNYQKLHFLMYFTIITPSLNYGNFIGDCLRSVASQEGVLVEHLVIDGESNDDTANIVSTFPHARFQSGKDKGMSDAINMGFNLAKGDWVMWLNADDRLKPGILSSLVEQLEQTDADVVYGNFDFVDTDGNFMRHLRMPRWSRFVHVHHHCYIGSTTAFYRRKTVIDKGHRLRTDFKYVMDGEFYARLDQLGMRFERIDLNVADFRLHSGNLSQKNLGLNRDMDKIIEAEKQFIESRAIRRAYGFTLFHDPYLNGMVDGVLWLVAKAWKFILKLL